VLLAIEARIGQLLPSVEETRKLLGEKQRGTSRKERTGIHVLPKGMDSRQAYRARVIAAHSKEVEEVIKEAEENEDIPTKTAVLNKIAY